MADAGEWDRAPLGSHYLDRWILRNSGNGLRILKRAADPSCWLIRYDDSPGMGVPIPGDLSIEEAQAMAIVLWRMK